MLVHCALPLGNFKLGGNLSYLFEPFFFSGVNASSSHASLSGYHQPRKGSTDGVATVPYEWTFKGIMGIEV